MNKENFEGYLFSTNLGCSEKFIDLLCQNLDLSTDTIKSNIHYSYRETHKYEVCNATNFELYSYHYEDWTKMLNQLIADQLREKYTVNTVSLEFAIHVKGGKL